MLPALRIVEHLRIGIVQLRELDLRSISLGSLKMLGAGGDQSGGDLHHPTMLVSVVVRINGEGFIKFLIVVGMGTLKCLGPNPNCCRLFIFRRMV